MKALLPPWTRIEGYYPAGTPAALQRIVPSNDIGQLRVPYSPQMSPERKRTEFFARKHHAAAERKEFVVRQPVVRQKKPVVIGAVRGHPLDGSKYKASCEIILDMWAAGRSVEEIATSADIPDAGMVYNIISRLRRIDPRAQPRQKKHRFSVVPQRGSDWTPARIALMLELNAGGMTAMEISQRLGGVTRSAVIGKLHRARRDSHGDRSSAVHEAASAAQAENKQ